MIERILDKLLRRKPCIQCGKKVGFNSVFPLYNNYGKTKYFCSAYHLMEYKKKEDVREDWQKRLEK